MVGQTLAAVIVVAAGGVASIATGTSPSVVPCRDIIGDPQFPYRSGGCRLVLGVLSRASGLRARSRPCRR